MGVLWATLLHNIYVTFFAKLDALNSETKYFIDVLICTMPTI